MFASIAPLARRSIGLVAVIGSILTLAGCSERFDLKAVEPSVFRILVFYKDFDKNPVTASGFLVKKPNVVATNWHVVHQFEEDSKGNVLVDKNGVRKKEYKIDSILICSVELNKQSESKNPYKNKEKDKGEKSRKVEKDDIKCPTADPREVKDNEGLDLALLKADETLGGNPLSLSADTPGQGTDVVSLGYPGASDVFVRERNWSDRFATFLQVTMTQGSVSKILEEKPVGKILHQATISPGSSGGPLLDACGTVVGVNAWTTKEPSGIFGAVSAKELAKFMELHDATPVKNTTPCQRVIQDRALPYAIGGGAAVLALMSMVIALRRPGPVRERVTRMFTGREMSRRPTDGPLRPIQSSRTPSPTEAADATTFMPSSSTGGASTSVSGSLGGTLRLVPASGGNPISIALDRLSSDGAVVGRESDSDLIVDHKTVSKHHARLRYDGSKIVAEDLNSNNGTWRGSQRVAKRESFSSGETIRFGAAEYRIDIARPGGGGSAGGNADATAFMPAPQRSRSWILSGFDSNGKVVQFALEPKTDAARGEESETTWTVGRASGADHIINEQSISGQHAELRFDPRRGLEIRDMKSANGTKVDGRRIGMDYVSLAGARTIELGVFKLSLSQS